MSNVTDNPIRSEAKLHPFLFKDFLGARFVAGVYLGVATVILLVGAISASITYALMHRHGDVWWLQTVIVFCIILVAIFLASSFAFFGYSLQLQLAVNVGVQKLSDDLFELELSVLADDQEHVVVPEDA